MSEFSPEQESYASNIQRRMNQQAAGGLDLEVGEETLRQQQRAQLALAKQLAAEYECKELCLLCGRAPAPPNARDIAHLAKSSDETGRFLKFMMGEADHRSAWVGEESSVLRCLSDEQLSQVMAWVSEAKGR